VPFHDALFASQDSLGVIPFEEFARRAGVPDLVGFSACAASSDTIPGLGADTLAARALGIRGTPTFLVPGVMLGGVPDSGRLEREIDAALSNAGVKRRL
jgi:protein-disulfide isomerase